MHFETNHTSERDSCYQNDTFLKKRKVYEMIDDYYVTFGKLLAELK